MSWPTVRTDAAGAAGGAYVSLHVCAPILACVSALMTFYASPERTYPQAIKPLAVAGRAGKARVELWGTWDGGQQFMIADSLFKSPSVSGKRESTPYALFILALESYFRLVPGPLRILGIWGKRLAAFWTCGSPLVCTSSPVERPETRLSSSTLIFSLR